MNNKTPKLNSKQRLNLKVCGLFILMVGVVTIGTLALMSSANLTLILIALALILIGLLFIASPEAVAIIMEAISWIP